MRTNIKSEHLTRLKELIAFIPDPSVRLSIEFAALEFGSERYAAGHVDASERQHRASDEPWRDAPLMLGAPT